jgi:hypothetical protein
MLDFIAVVLIIITMCHLHYIELRLIRMENTLDKN